MSESAEVIAQLLVSQTLCQTCLAAKTGFTRWQVEDGLRYLGEMVRATTDRCQACRNRSTVVFSLA